VASRAFPIVRERASIARDEPKLWRESAGHKQRRAATSVNGVPVHRFGITVFVSHFCDTKNVMRLPVSDGPQDAMIV
jgi:hypothetical protein